MSMLPSIQVGAPLVHQGLAVFPLFTSVTSSADYLLGSSALAEGLVTVEEMNEAGSVPFLKVTNRADRPLLFLEGEELRGAKQNRVLNTSVLVRASGETVIPVSCVEAGRWHYRGRHFVGGTYSSPGLRGKLKPSVTLSALSGRGHASDQGEVWSKVASDMHMLGATSGTSAMADTYETHAARLDDFRQQLPYVEGASGLAVATAGQVVAVDLFDKPATCRSVWDRLLSGAALDSLMTAPPAAQARPVDVEQFLQRVAPASWTGAPVVGIGQEFRCQTADGVAGSALKWDDAVIHSSVVACT